MAYFRPQREAGDGLYANYVITEFSDVTLSADAGSFSLEGYPASLIVFAPPGVEDLEISAEAGYFALDIYPVSNVSDITLSAEMGTFALSGYPAELITTVPTLTFPLNDGSGDVARCLENPAYNATVDPADWVTTTYNNKRWPINEGASALLNETETGDDTYDATIQNFTEDGWG